MKYVLVNGFILDGTIKMEVLKDYNLYIDDDTISDIVKSVEPLKKGYKVIDLKGGYLMPGLVNLHVHLPSGGIPKKKASDPVKLVKLMTSNRFLRWVLFKLCEHYAKIELKSGVTTLRTVGGIIDIDSKLRDYFNQGKALGPRMFVSNMAISVEGGHMAKSLAYEAHDEEEARALVRKIYEDKPDLIKLMITGGVLDAKVKGEPGALKMPKEIVKAACSEAHKLKMIVAAHVESPLGVKVALENGVDTIEHGAKLDDEMIELFKKRNCKHVLTISPALPFALFDQKVSHASDMGKYNGKIVFDGVLSCAQTCLANDIPVGLGTDTGCPFITHYDMWREVNYFSKYCNVSKKFALSTATLGNAKILGIDKEIGSIEVGKKADLIVSKFNPLDDLTVLRNLTFVIHNGKILKNPKIKKSKVCERELDKFL